jgi:hypothetical protein
MDAVFTDEDHAYIMREARRIDSSCEEARRREEIVDFRIKTAEMQKTKALAKSPKDAKNLQENLTRQLVPPPTMDAPMIPFIHEQLNPYRAQGVPNLLVNSKYPRKADKLAVLKEAFRRYEANGMPVMMPIVPQNILEVVPAIVEELRDEEDAEMEE